MREEHRPPVCPSNDSARVGSYQEFPTSIQLWRDHGQEAKRGEVSGPRITRHVKRLGRFSSRVRHQGVLERRVVADRCNSRGPP